MIHICIPAHNEAQTVGAVLWKTRKVMLEFERDFTIHVFDDASTDETPEVLERYRKHLPLRIHRSDRRLGWGPAVERLMREAIRESEYPKRDIIVTLQADFTEDPADIVPMIKSIEGGADLVVGHLEGIDRPYPRRRRLVGWIARRLVRKAPVRDPLSPLRAYRIIVVKKAFRGEADGEIQSTGRWPAALELLSVTVPHARRIEESPYHLRYAHRTRSSRFEAMPTLKSVLPLRRLEWRESV
jgi:glycosyltransferase involved in cell wall biosynthesis